MAIPGVLENDTDPDEDELTATLVSDPQNGTLTFNSDGSFEYVPHAAFHGSDSFVYAVSNGIDSDEATVTILVKAAPSQSPTEAVSSKTVNRTCPNLCKKVRISTNDQAGSLQVNVSAGVSFTDELGNETVYTLDQPTGLVTQIIAAYGVLNATTSFTHTGTPNHARGA